jgi:mono/diheme cytochrome c family protein
MVNFARRTIVLLCAFAFSASVIALAQEQPKPTVKSGSITHTALNSGPEMFNAYCAVCHGKDGKGNGPAAPEFKTPPSDLTVLTANNKGKFPADHVAQVIENGAGKTRAHGTRDMPMWGPAFRSLSETPPQTRLRIYNLSKYIESLQGK